MQRVTNNKWFYRIMSLFFALLLFFNANSQSYTNTASTSESHTYDQTVENIPITLQYDTDKYFVSGYDESTNVYLTSANRILLDKETNAQTRSFTINADLRKYGTGTYEVPLKVKNLSGAVSAELKQTTIHVTIDTKETKDFDVTPNVDSSIVKDGYMIDSVTASPTSVSITSGKDIIADIDKVTATISDKSDVTETFSENLDVKAYDSEGNELSIVASPAQVSVEVKVSQPSKTVPISVKQTGKQLSTVSDYTFTLSTEKIKIYGSSATLDTIESIEVDVDVSNIDSTTKKKVNLSFPDGVSSDDDSITVTVIPTLLTSDTSSKNSNSSNNTNSSSTTSSTNSTNSGSSTSSSSSSEEESSVETSN